MTSWLGSLTLAEKAALLFAVDPIGLGGVVLRGGPGPMRERWLRNLIGIFPGAPSVKRVPHNVSDTRLMGGLDLAATLQAGRPVTERGLLADADGGLLMLHMAERTPAITASIIAAAIDRGEVAGSRGDEWFPARFSVIAFDEGIDDEAIPPVLSERLAFTLASDMMQTGNSGIAAMQARAADARERLAMIEAAGRDLESLSAAALSLGIVSLRAPLFALRAARAAAALDASAAIHEEHLKLAAELVLAHRALVLPAPEEQPESPPPAEDNSGKDGEAQAGERALEDMVLESAKASIPPELLARLGGGLAPRRSRSAGGRAGARQKSLQRGRPVGVRQGDPRSGTRLNLIATLTAAAPWQTLRRRERPVSSAKVLIQRPDFRVTRFQERTATTTIFAVDASGSSAMQRLAEAKGAVELLLAECYVRRDQVALFAFRREGTELLLPPTRSLARAKRSLAAMPGGGGTPLASAIVSAAQLADALQRKNQTPIVIFLTDGHANIARDGSGGRERANADALAAAKLFRAQGFKAVVVDTSARPGPLARGIAAELGAEYLALPYADAAALQRGVSALTRSA